MANNPGIESFTDLYLRIGQGRPYIAQLLTGHLAIEFLLSENARLSGVGKRKIRNSNHSELIQKNFELSLINDNQRHVLLSINRLRNELAHQINKDIDIDTLLYIWKSAEASFSDLTDGIRQGIDSLENHSDVSELDDWIIPEFFVQICYDLHIIYVELGGDDEISRR